MTNATARAFTALAVALLFTPITSAPAQLVRGIVKGQESKATLDRASITVHDTLGREIGETRTDAGGRFHLALKSVGKPFIITVKRLGIKPTTSSPMTLAASDTTDIELLVEESETPPLDTVRVGAAEMLNEKRLKEAKRRGWKVLSPIDIERNRERANTLKQLIQTLPTAGVVAPSSDYGCFKNLRNGNCMTIVVDGRVMGPTAYVQPNDIYFIAIVPQNDAIIQYGTNYAPFGAIAIYTRQNGDVRR
ncbi:MAG: carboxypeptidase-like regulatory domain-containing protein [Gemmatimonas sp.]